MRKRKPKPLTENQIDVLRKLASGWSVAVDCTVYGRTWAQKGMLGHGGESVTLNHHTITSLWQRGLIRQGRRDFPSQLYVLTAEGRKAWEEIQGAT